jgi:hypothetical protein
MALMHARTAQPVLAAFGCKSTNFWGISDIKGVKLDVVCFFFVFLQSERTIV